MSKPSRRNEQRAQAAAEREADGKPKVSKYAAKLEAEHRRIGAGKKT